MPIQQQQIPNFSLNIPRPTERLLSGIQQGLGIGQILEQRKQAQAAQVQQQQTKDALTNLNAIENPTAEDYTKVASLLPKAQADNLRSSWELLSKDKQSNQLKFAAQTMAAFNANPEIAISMLERRAESERNAGNEDEAKGYETWAAIAKEDPDAVSRTMGIMVSSLPGGKDVIDSVNKLGGRGRGAGEKAFAPVTLINPETKEKIPHIPTFDPATGKARLEPADLPEGFVLSKETAGEKRQAEVVQATKVTTAKKLAEQAVNASTEAFKKIPLIEKGINNINRAISAIDEGAKTGVINSLLPSVRTASIKLDQAANELGLDVVSSITFGALSEKELALAKETALPTKLAPPELRAWLVEKRRVQEILLDKINEAARFLGSGGTVAELLEERRSARKLEEETPSTITDNGAGADIKSKADAILGIQ